MYLAQVELRQGDQAVIASNLIKHLMRDERGATAVEYGLIVSLIVITLIGVMNSMANETQTMWSFVETQIKSARTG